MTQTSTVPQVFLCYKHPMDFSVVANRCRVSGWIASASAVATDLPSERTDAKCMMCAVPGEFDRKMFERVEGEKTDRNSLPHDLEPSDILPGYPALFTNQGYETTS